MMPGDAIERIGALDELRSRGAIDWAADRHAWVGRPEDICEALAREGFAEYKREIARSARDREPAGGLWQGVNDRGAVGSAVWIVDGARAIVHVEVDGRAVEP